MNKDAIIATLQQELASTKAIQQAAADNVTTIEMAMAVLQGTHIKRFKLDQNSASYKMLKRASFVVEANDNERMELWRKYSNESPDTVKGYEWLSDNNSPGETIGKIFERNVNVSLTGATIEGVYVVFAYPTSQLVDYEMFDNWVNENFDGKYGGGRRAVVDAGHFHHVIHDIMDNKVQAA